MIRFLLAVLVLMAALGGFLLVGLFQPDPVYAYSPVTLTGMGPFTLAIQESEVLVTSDDSESACLPVHTITVDGGEPFTIDSDLLDGPLTSATICDLDGDEQLELLLTSRACGSGAFGNVYLLERENDAWVELHTGELTSEKQTGYMGHDKYTVASETLLNRYPLYAEEDSNVSPSAGERLVEYRLVENKLVSVASIESRK